MTKLPPPPFPLTKPELAFYKSIGADALKTKKFAAENVWALALLAQTMALQIRIREQLANVKNFTESTGRGGIKGDPRVGQLRDAVTQCTQLLGQLGLTPASRNRTTAATTATKEDELAGFIQGE